MEPVVYSVHPNSVNSCHVEPDRRPEGHRCVAMFVGPDAVKRANEYAEFMNLRRNLNPDSGLGAILGNVAVLMAAFPNTVEELRTRLPTIEFSSDPGSGATAKAAEPQPAPEPSWRDKPPLL